ncbi:MAG: TonB C-terminal domain-containing protein [Candidatus Fermentibacteria bacterium]|nr:TonB C-terminal domain-containing protein [Candidatus Fermentibacteria bacterium]
MESSNPFLRLPRVKNSGKKSDIYLSAGIHTGILLLLVLVGLFARSTETIPMGGGEFVSVEMIILDTGDRPAEIIEEVIPDPVEEVQEEIEVVEVIEDPLESEVVEVEEVEEIVPEQVEEVQEETAPAQNTDFMGVGSEGEAGSGAPGPASYEGRVFSAIRRNFRTSVNPSHSYQISFTVNLDGSHSYEVVRASGDSGFDRAVTHALNSASIPPIPPGRTSPVNLQIEFFGPDV